MIGDEFTLPRARAVSRAVAHWLREAGHPARVLVAHDTRPGGERLAREASAVLVSEGVQVGRAQGATPTPVLARAVVRRKQGAGIVFTASHNPPAYQGLKVIGPGGGVLDSAPTARLEVLATGILSAHPEAPRHSRRAGAGRIVELVPEYLVTLGKRVDVASFARNRPNVLYDAMHGAGARVLDRFLASLGARVVSHRVTPDARFAGSGPDPIAERLATLSQTVRKTRGLVLGLATDGDGDRYAAVDSSGRVLSPTEAVALLVDHLARSGRIRRGIAISIATGSLVERVARSHGLPVTRHPIGFKWLTRALLAGDADCAGEESGGFVWADHGVDKDGILAGALLAELVATSGEPLGARLAALERLHGACHCGRIQIAESSQRRDRLEKLRRAPPARIAGVRVRSVDRRDGLRLELPDGFVMLRASGTEPAFRIYAEAPSAALLRARLALGARWLGAHSSGNLAI